MKPALKTTFVLLVILGTLYGTFKLSPHSDSKSSESKTDATLSCDGLPPLNVKFLGTEVSGSFKVKLFSNDGALSRVLHAPSSKCMLMEDPK